MQVYLSRSSVWWNSYHPDFNGFNHLTILLMMPLYFPKKYDEKQDLLWKNIEEVYGLLAKEGFWIEVSLGAHGKLQSAFKHQFEIQSKSNLWSVTMSSESCRSKLWVSDFVLISGQFTSNLCNQYWDNWRRRYYTKPKLSIKLPRAVSSWNFQLFQHS